MRLTRPTNLNFLVPKVTDLFTETQLIVSLGATKGAAPGTVGVKRRAMLVQP